MIERLSLRARLVLGVIALAAVGLAVADVATYASLRSFLFDRTDKSLDQAHHSFERSMSFGGGCPSEDGRPPPGSEPGEYYEVRSATGRVLCRQQVARFGEEVPSPPDLPRRISEPSTRRGPDRVSYFVVDARDGGERYRVRASTEPNSDSLFVVALPLSSVDATLRRLLLIELLVTAAVLAALAALALWVVRVGLRPLAAIGETAAAIAGGDLSRRVERAEPRTEVGRLGMALNGMLARIESSFHAQQASERKLRRFIADASHELRTPIAAVRAYAELFGRGAAQRPDDLARSMRGISRESERMSLLVDDLLLLARLDEGRPLEREPVELEQVVAEAVETARAVDPERPIELVTEPATVTGDRQRLRQIVDNLLANARAHTPPATPVNVRVGRVDGQAVIEVEDRGPGMQPGDADRVFERFYRADESRSRGSGGVGLGLSIVSAVAEAHGGTATATSEPGAGATFRIRLPLADRNGDVPASPAPATTRSDDHD